MFQKLNNLKGFAQSAHSIASISRNTWRRNECRGFTLLELMITLVIAATLLAVAVPSIQEFLQKNRIESEKQNIVQMLQTTRNLAMTTNRHAYLCRSGIKTVDLNNVRCATGSVEALDWNQFLMVYSRRPNSPVVPPNNSFGNQRLQRIEGDRGLRQEMLKASSEKPNDTITITANRPDLVIRFNPDGTIENNTPFRIALCRNDGNESRYGAMIEISASGQIRSSALNPDDPDRNCAPSTNI